MKGIPMTSQEIKQFDKDMAFFERIDDGCEKITGDTKKIQAKCDRQEKPKSTAGSRTNNENYELFV